MDADLDADMRPGHLGRRGERRLQVQIKTRTSKQVASSPQIRCALVSSAALREITAPTETRREGNVTHARPTSAPSCRRCVGHPVSLADEALPRRSAGVSEPYTQPSSQTTHAGDEMAEGK